jgi:hypothetical protein
VLDSTNKNDKTQFRVRKDGREALVDVRFDRETGQSTQVNAFPLTLTTSRQQTARVQGRHQQSSQTGSMRRMVQELESLPVSRDRSFYRQALQQRGFNITDTDVQEDRTRFEAEKNGRRIVLDVEFDENTGRGTSVDARRISGAQQLSQAR